MPLSRQKLNDIWQSGFCPDTVRHAAGTEDYDSDLRIGFLTRHIMDKSVGGDSCEECKRAITLKNLEAKAVRLSGGTEALGEFYLGREAHDPKAARAVILGALREGIIDQEFIEWMGRIAEERVGKDFPG